MQKKWPTVVIELRTRKGARNKKTKWYKIARVKTEEEDYLYGLLSGDRFAFY
mgnify:CR=1 FL=1